MKKINKFLPILAITILLFTPCYANATEETNGAELTDPTPSATPDPTPSATPTPSPLASPEPTPTPTPSATPKPTKEPTQYKITLDQKKLELNVDKTATLKATVTPSDDSVEIEWSSSNNEAVSVDQNGKITVGTKAAQDIIITATIKGTDVKATCTVDVSRTIGKDATLKSLNISNGSLDKTFKSNILEYSVTVDSNVNFLKFKDLQSDLSDSNAGYMVTGNNNLKNGSTVSILVTAEDGETNKTYKLTIVKDTVSLNLKSLKINGYALNEVFDKETLEYTASIPYEIETITVQAAAEDSDAAVKVSGITNLKVGENTVNIVVQDTAGNSRTYTIIVTREKEVSVEEKPTSIITSSNTNNQTSSNTTDATTQKNDNDDNFLKYAIVSLACLILLTIGGIGIYFYIKTSPKKLKKELNNQNETNEEISPIIEVENTTTTEKQGNIEEIMNEKLVETREFKKEDLEVISETENLFDEDEDA